jgi:hypothetical protein
MTNAERLAACVEALNKLTEELTPADDKRRLDATAELNRLRGITSNE